MVDTLILKNITPTIYIYSYILLYTLSLIYSIFSNIKYSGRLIILMLWDRKNRITCNHFFLFTTVYVHSGGQNTWRCALSSDRRMCRVVLWHEVIKKSSEQICHAKYNCLGHSRKNPLWTWNRSKLQVHDKSLQLLILEYWDKTGHNFFSPFTVTMYFSPCQHWQIKTCTVRSNTYKQQIQRYTLRLSW